MWITTTMVPLGVISSLYFTRKSLQKIRSRKFCHSLHTTMVSLDSITSQSPIATGRCEGGGLRMECVRRQEDTERPTSTASSWLSSSIEMSTSTIKYLSSWGINVGEASSPQSGSNNDDDDDNAHSWRNVPNSSSNRNSPGRQNLQSNDKLPTTCTIRSIVDRKEIYKNVRSSHQAAKTRLAKAVDDTRKSKKDARLLQYRVSAPSPPPASIARIESEPMLKTQRKVNETIEPLRSAFQAKKLRSTNASVHFNLSLNKTVIVPRVDPADKPILFFRPKEFRVFNRNELNLFHAYHFYQDMYNDEMNFESKEALRRRMSSIANLMFSAPGGKDGSRKRKRTPPKKKRK